MKVNLLFILVSFSILLGCKSQLNRISCNENEEFKTTFFRQINVIEYYIAEGRNRDQYIKALNFLATFSNVNFGSMYNYGTTYPYIVFLKDREQWLKWYENNKCNNLQIPPAIEDKYHQYHKW